MPEEKPVIIKIETPEGEILHTFDYIKDYKDKPLARLLEDLEEAIWNDIFREKYVEMGMEVVRRLMEERLPAKAQPNNSL